MGAEHGAPENRVQPMTLGKRGYLEQLFLGVVIGVTVGLVLAASAAIFDHWSRANERREQITFFAELANKMQEVCDNTAALKTGQVYKSADQMRHFHFRNHARHLQHALEGRATRLTFDEIYEVENVHSYINLVLNKLGSSLSEDACSELMSSLENTSLL